MQPVLTLDEFLEKMYRDSRLQLEEYQDILEDTVPHMEVGVKDEEFKKMEGIVEYHCKNVTI